MTTPEQTFREIAPPFMDLLLEDFPALDKLDAAAVFGGGAGHESNGFTQLQEVRPTVPGSRGGYGWFQWTGPRRKAYEAYCLRNGKDPAAAASNYAFLFVELKGPEAGTIDALVNAPTLYAKVRAFDEAFERSGVPNYPSRNQWALIALDAYEKWLAARAAEDDAPDPPETLPEPPVAETATIETVTRLAQMTDQQLSAAAMAIAMAQAVRRGWRVEDPQGEIPAPRTPGIVFTQPPTETDAMAMETKSFLKSKTLIGIALTAIPILFPQAAPLVLPLRDMAGIDPQATAQITDVVNSGVQIVGLILALYGRFTAKTQISLKG